MNNPNQNPPVSTRVYIGDLLAAILQAIERLSMGWGGFCSGLMDRLAAGGIGRVLFGINGSIEINRINQPLQILPSFSSAPASSQIC